MKKILMNRKPVSGPWGGGNHFVKAIDTFAKDHGYEIVYSFDKHPDAVILVDPRYDGLGISANEVYSYKMKNPNVKILHRINECDARKGTKDIDLLLKSCAEKMDDAIVHISQWLLDYHGWKHQNERVVYNGTNLEHFFPEDNKLSSDNIRIVVHHWSDNIMKNKFTHNIDEFVGQNPGYEFTYIGRAPKGLENTKVIPPLVGKQIGDELKKHDVYITSTLFDPAPNSTTEALACGLPVYGYKNSGGVCEMIGEDHVYNSWEELEKILKSKDFSKNENSIEIKSWEETAGMYFSILDDLLK